MNALELFRRGYDTKEIANLLRATEAEIYNEIHCLRQREQRCAYMRDYMPKYRLKISRPKSSLVRFAGYDVAEKPW